MKRIIFCFIILCIGATSCNKHKLDQNLEPIKDLFDKDGIWYVEKLEIEGKDSTGIAYPGIERNREVSKMVFTPSVKRKEKEGGITGNGYSAMLEYAGPIATLHCFNVKSSCNSSSDKSCVRNIFMLWCSGSGWKVDSISSNRVVLTADTLAPFNFPDVKKEYKLILTR